ncbi:MAG TPA: MBL fold metallo-hydrolase [Dongiaceae bacterium]|nr:MBL fold metallo-hydrolase [Dongiaceae bacterium]
MSNRPDVRGFFDTDTSTVSYVVIDPATHKAALIDSVLDYDPASGRTRTTSADRLIAHVEEQHAEVAWILETHVHADHLSAAPYLKRRLGGQIGIGFAVVTIQNTFGKIFNSGDDFNRDGRQFDHLFQADESFALGSIRAQALYTPGHTPACMTYLIGDAAFVGDTLFMPDYGTARCDFPGGSARILYRSIQRLFTLPAETRLFMCHDYLPEGRKEFRWETTVGVQKRENVHIGQGISEVDFVAMRESRDAKLAMPKLILPAVQVNMRAGQLPPPEENGVSYLKVPVNGL